MPTNLTRSEVSSLIDGGDVVLLEALPRPHWESQHLPGALSLPLDDIETLAPQLVTDLGRQIVVYCANLACANSGIAAAALERLGYTNVATYEAGKQDWVEAGLPVESSLAPSGQ